MGELIGAKKLKFAPITKVSLFYKSRGFFGLLTKISLQKMCKLAGYLGSYSVSQQTPLPHSEPL